MSVSSVKSENEQDKFESVESTGDNLNNCNEERVNCEEAADSRERNESIDEEKLEEISIDDSEKLQEDIKNSNTTIDEDKLEEISMEDSEKHDEESKSNSANRNNLNLNIAPESMDNVPKSNLVENKSPDINEKMTTFKKWGFDTFIRTKQKVMERLSKTTRTYELELEDKIDSLKLQQTQLRMLQGVKRDMISKIQVELITQQMSVRLYSDMSHCSGVYLNSLYAGQAYKMTAVVEQMKILIGRLTESCEALETLTSKTIPDMIMSVNQFDKARAEYDGYKMETEKTLNLLKQQQNTAATSAKYHAKLEELQTSLEDKKVKYEQVKEMLQQKLDFFEDNRKRVIERELQNSNNAWSVYHKELSTLYSAVQTNETNQNNK